jgi:hypothetical protein
MLGLEVTDRLFAVLGVPPMLGRTFLPGEDGSGQETVAVLGHVWRAVSLPIPRSWAAT